MSPFIFSRKEIPHIYLMWNLPVILDDNVFIQIFSIKKLCGIFRSVKNPRQKIQLQIDDLKFHLKNPNMA